MFVCVCVHVSSYIQGISLIYIWYMAQSPTQIRCYLHASFLTSAGAFFAYECRSGIGRQIQGLLNKQPKGFTLQASLHRDLST